MPVKKNVTLDEIIHRLNNPNWTLRSDAIASLEDFPLGNALPILKHHLLSDENKYVRQRF